MKNLLCCLLFMAVSGVAMASTSNIGGKYTCSGFDPFVKKAYTANIRFKKTGDTYKVTLNSDKGDNLRGTGILDSNNRFIAITLNGVTAKNEASTSVTYYVISNNGATLNGTWAFLGGKKVVTENCQRK